MRGQGSAAAEASVELAGALKGRMRADTHAIMVAESRADAERAAAILEAEAALKSQQSKSASTSPEEYDASLCQGIHVTVDLADAGFMGLLEKQLVGPGMQMMSATLPGITPAGESGGAGQATASAGPMDEIPGLACVIPRAICGEGRQGALRLDVHKPAQLHADIYCDPQEEVVGTLFVAAQDLKPQDQERLGMAAIGPEVQAAEIGAQTLSALTRDGADDYGAGRMEMVGVLASPKLGGGVEQVRLGLPLAAATEEPRARRALVRALDRVLTVVYNADAEFQRTRDAAKRLGTIL